MPDMTMTMSRPSSVPDTPASFESHERADLAGKIARFDQMSSALDDTRQRARSGIDARLSEAYNARAAAETALREAEDPATASRSAMARALNPSDAGPTVAQLRTTLDEARKRFDAVWADRELVQSEIERLARAVDFARVERDQALAAVLAPAAAELLAELTANRRRILFLENTIVAIRKLVPIRLPMDWSTPGERRTPADWVPDADVLTLWREAIEKLTVDATAPLPGDDD
jgi:hypothetical protein